KNPMPVTPGGTITDQMAPRTRPATPEAAMPRRAIFGDTSSWGSGRLGAQSGQRAPTSVMTAQRGQIGVPQRPQARPVSTCGWRAQRISVAKVLVGGSWLCAVGNATLFRQGEEALHGLFRQRDVAGLALVDAAQAVVIAAAERYQFVAVGQGLQARDLLVVVVLVVDFHAGETRRLPGDQQLVEAL